MCTNRQIDLSNTFRIEKPTYGTTKRTVFLALRPSCKKVGDFSISLANLQHSHPSFAFSSSSACMDTAQWPQVIKAKHVFIIFITWNHSSLSALIFLSTNIFNLLHHAALFKSSLYLYNYCHFFLLWDIGWSYIIHQLPPL